MESERSTAAPTGGVLKCQSGGRSRQIVEAMLDFTHQHFQRPMALREVATRLRMNPNYLSWLFHETTGTTFHHHLDALRLARAKELLSDVCIHIREVAYASGYASPNHFRAFFKAREGISPAAWRDVHFSVERGRAPSLSRSPRPQPEELHYGCSMGDGAGACPAA